MATNPYFNNYYAKNEQDLIEGMVIEAIQMKGIDLVYLHRTQDNLDYLYREDSDSVFNERGNGIEMWPAFVDGFDGDITIGRFDIDFAQTATFIVSKKRFKEEFPDINGGKPREGDLLYMPITNAVMEIKYVNPDSPFFQKGKQYVWEVKAELFRYSHEEINIDALPDMISMDEDDFLLDGDEPFVPTPPEPKKEAFKEMELERFFEDDYQDSDDDGDKIADNDELYIDMDEYIEVDPDNPFGAR